MGLRNWLQHKREEANKISEQARAELLRRQIQKQEKEGGVHQAYRLRMNPLEYGKQKMMEYLQKK